MALTALRPTSIVHGMSRLARDLTGRSADRLITLIAEQVEVTCRGFELVDQLTQGRVASTEARELMRDLEHEGDASRAELVSHLGTVLSTPIDAEDLFRLSRSVDDVLDNLRDFVREVDLFQPADLRFEQPVVFALALGIRSLGTSVDCLHEARGTATQDATLATRKAAGNARRLYQDQLATLFERALDGETLQHRELLRRLDVVGLRLCEAADALADGMLKRGR